MHFYAKSGAYAHVIVQDFDAMRICVNIVEQEQATGRKEGPGGLCLSNDRCASGHAQTRKERMTRGCHRLLLKFPLGLFPIQTMSESQALHASYVVPSQLAVLVRFAQLVYHCTVRMLATVRLEGDV